MAVSPGNVDCAVQMAMWFSPEVSPPPQVTIVHSGSNQCINLSLFSFIAQIWKQANGAQYKSFVVLWMRQFCNTLKFCPSWSSDSAFHSWVFSSFCHFCSPTPILVSSLLQRWSPWLTLNTSYCLCTLRSILGRTGSGEKMTMITPDWPSKTCNFSVTSVTSVLSNKMSWAVPGWSTGRTAKSEGLVHVLWLHGRRHGEVFSWPSQSGCCYISPCYEVLLFLSGFLTVCSLLFSSLVWFCLLRQSLIFCTATWM